MAKKLNGTVIVTYRCNAKCTMCNRYKVPSKPEEEIFRRCAEQLGVTYEECLYVGDGGSRELETAEHLGMKPVQAVWYLQKGSKQPVFRKPEFLQAESPLEILNYLES